jgi:hypothetical protein
MIRRWFLSCIATMLGTMLAADAVAQSPTSLAERIKQLRRDWTQDEETPKEGETAERSVMVASPRAGSAQGPQSPATSPRGGLPQVESRSLLPSNMRGNNGDRYGNATSKPAAAGQLPRRSVAPSNVSTKPVAAKSPSILGESARTQRYSTARRSPPQRPPVDFESGTLHEELTTTSSAPATIEQTVEPTPVPTAAAEPTILDDFAAGLAEGAKKPVSISPTAAPSKPSVTPVPIQAAIPRGPINLPATPPRPVAASTPTAVSGPEPTPATDDRYGATSVPAPAARMSSIGRCASGPARCPHGRSRRSPPRVVRSGRRREPRWSRRARLEPGSGDHLRHPRSEADRDWPRGHVPCPFAEPGRLRRRRSRSDGANSVLGRGCEHCCHEWRGASDRDRRFRDFAAMADPAAGCSVG